MLFRSISGSVGTKRCYAGEPNSVSVDEHKVSINLSLESTIIRFDEKNFYLFYCN